MKCSNCGVFSTTRSAKPFFLESFISSCNVFSLIYISKIYTIFAPYVTVIIVRVYAQFFIFRTHSLIILDKTSVYLFVNSRIKHEVVGSHYRICFRCANNPIQLIVSNQKCNQCGGKQASWNNFFFRLLSDEKSRSKPLVEFFGTA